MINFKLEPCIGLPSIVKLLKISKLGTSNLNMERIQVSHVALKRHKAASKLHRVAANNNRKELELLLNSGENIYQLCEEVQMTPLAYALNNCRKYAANEILKIYTTDYNIMKALEIDNVDVVYDKNLTNLIVSRASDIKNSEYTIPVLLKTSNFGTRSVIKWLPVYPSSIDDCLIEIHHRLKLSNSKCNINLPVTPIQNTYFHLIVAYNYDTLFDLLVNNFTVDYNAINSAGQTPLHFALKTGNLNFIEFLLPHTKNIDRHLLYKYAYNFNVFELIYQPDDFNLPEILVFYLTNCHDTFLVKFIQFYELNLNEIQDSEGNNALHLLLIHNNYWNFNDSLFKYLVKKWPQLVNRRNNNNLLPIHLVLGNCNICIDYVKLLLVFMTGSIRFETSVDYKILFQMIRSETVNLKKFYYLFFTRKITLTSFFINKLLRKLISSGVDLKVFKKFYAYNLAKLKFDIDHDRILLKIAKYKLENYFWFVVQNRNHIFNYNTIDKSGNNALLYFCESGSARLVEFLLDHKCDAHQINYDNWTTVHKSMLNRNVNILKMIFEKNVKCENYTRDTNEFPIMIAARLNHLQHFYFVYAKYEFRSGPLFNELLMQSCQLRVPIIFLSLIRNQRINLNYQDANGDTILHLISTPNYYKYLLNCKRPLKLSIKNANGQTPIMQQILHYCDENVIQLLKIMPTTNLSIMHDSSNMYLVDYFAQVMAVFGAKYAKVLKTRRYKKIFRNAIPNDIKSPLKMSIQYHNLKILKLIIKNSTQSYLVSEISYLIENNWPQYIKFILSKFHIDLNTISNLHATMLKCNFDMLKYLVVNCNLDLNAKNENGENYLHFAVRRGNLFMVDFMIKHGADWRQVNIFGKAPFDDAEPEMLNNFMFLF